jgi:hypothetical protein
MMMRELTGLALRGYVRVAYHAWAYLLSLSSGSAAYCYSGSEESTLLLLKAVCLSAGIAGMSGTLLSRTLRA